MSDYETNMIKNRYLVLKYDKENGAIMPQHKKAELDRYERIIKKYADKGNKKLEM